jgi:phosphoenolpyruvate-protein phosphotransferase
MMRAVRQAAASGADPRDAGQRLTGARQGARLELTAGLEAVPEGPARQILRAHLALLDDPFLTAEIDTGVQSGLSAEDALARAASSIAARFAKLGDPALRARAADVSDVCECIARHIAGNVSEHRDIANRVVCASDLTPAQVLRFFERRPAACVLETAVDTSHAAILLRALGVPAVIGVARITELAADGDLLVVDGSQGHVVADPEPAVVAALEFAPAASAETDAEPVLTLDGASIAITATVVDATDARRAIAAGADGIGLFRTEWVFLRADSLPTEQQQYEGYREIAALAGARPVTMRTIDLGSDKRPPGLSLGPERNPALGLRGVRLAFAYPDVMKTQLRALFRAFEGRRLRLLLPMVTDASDVARMRELVDQAGGGTAAFDMGVMIETPAAALMAEEIAAVVDFLSLGTNDLTQYVLAVDRENASTASLYQRLHPAVLRILRHIMTAAKLYGRPVSVCGELASDPVAARLLIGMGIGELSVPAAKIARTKRLVRQISVAGARVLAEELIALPTAAAVATRLDEMRIAQADSDVLAARHAQ